MKVTIVYSDLEQIENIDFPSEIELTILDENSMKTRRKARVLKSSFAAKQTPCVFIYNENNKVYKVFYKEEHKDPITVFLNWYNESKN